MEYKTKEEYRKPNKNTNIYIAIFTTAHARLRLYKFLEILGERVLYMDTDSVIYIDDESEACKEIKSLIGSNLGQLTNELDSNHITVHVAAAPKDYGYELDNGKIKIKNKGIIMRAEAEEKITFGKKIDLVKDNNTSAEAINNTQFVLNKVDNKVRNKSQVKVYDFEFNKRMIVRENDDSIFSLPYGF
jgi:hypothetical protein